MPQNLAKVFISVILSLCPNFISIGVRDNVLGPYDISHDLKNSLILEPENDDFWRHKCRHNV